MDEGGELDVDRPQGERAPRRRNGLGLDRLHERRDPP